MSTILIFFLSIMMPQNIEAVIDGDAVIQVLPKDAIPAIDVPRFVHAADATFMRDDEIVIGVTDGTDAKAYSTWLLDGHEIVNDTIGSTPISVTWCPLCYTGIVYVREVGGSELTFGVSGRLWRDNLVMYDRQTDSYWAQAVGEAIRGEMKGAVLERYPSSMMTWKQWQDLHPNTLVLSKLTGRGLEGMQDRYRDYHRSSRIGVTRRTRFKKDNLGPKARVVAFRVGTEAFAVSLDDLRENVVLSTTAAGKPIVIVVTPDRTTAMVFWSGTHTFGASRKGSGRTLLIDDATKSEWDGFDGRAISGPMAGNQLEQIPSFISYWFAWKSFFPDSILLQQLD